MTQRYDVHQVSPEAYQAMLALGRQARNSGLEPGLIELVKIRISQINGCAFCLALHLDKARRLELSESQLHLLAVWREVPVFNERERAALAFAECLNRLPETGVPDALFEETSRHFPLADVSALAFVVVEIGSWNRLMVASRTPPLAEHLL